MQFCVVGTPRLGVSPATCSFVRGRHSQVFTVGEKRRPGLPGIFCLLISSATAAVGVRKYRRELQLHLTEKKHRSNTLASLSFGLEIFECQNERTLLLH